jgi:hypothetical protein
MVIIISDGILGKANHFLLVNFSGTILHDFVLFWVNFIGTLIIIKLGKYMIHNIIGNIIGIFVVAIFFSFLLSYPIMILWNSCLVPAVTILKEVGWLQMWGISFLFSILFKMNYTSNTK